MRVKVQQPIIRSKAIEFDELTGGVYRDNDGGIVLVDVTDGYTTAISFTSVTRRHTEYSENGPYTLLDPGDEVTITLSN